MKRRILGALFAVVGLSAMAGPAQAQAMLPAFEIATIVRSAGFAPLSPAFRRGETYVMRATRPDGREVRLVVDARRGRILSAVPVVAAARGGARAYGPIDGDEPDGPDGYIPPPPRGVYGSGPPVVYEGSRPVIYDRRPLEAIPNVPRGDAPPGIMREEGAQPGMLPPPPERFPSRAAPSAAAPPASPKPAAKPAPVKRAAAAPPLPKPKPAALADEPAANAAPEPQAAPPESKPDARELPH